MAQSTLSKTSFFKSASSRTSGKRLDIQGLRAIAVLAVVLDHLLHWPSGGFVGVDIFFVLSGFLITGLLLREHDRTGEISFSGFYRRRIRRIMPAAVTVLVVSTAAGFIVFNMWRAQQAAWDGLWGLIFWANWHFASVGTDYFQASDAISPFQHFWSLAVEEQFYLVWPWLMAGIFILGGRSAKWDKDRAHRAIAIAMVGIVAVSFFWALFETVSNPTFAYFSTFSRAWELGVGALLAVFASAFTRIPDRIRPFLAWTGIAGIVWSVFAVNAQSTFPAPWAAAPVLSTALVLIAGSGGERRFIAPLTNRVSGYIGDVSYSLYLWHFPIIIMAATLAPEGSVEFVLGCVVAMAFFTVASYHLVEKPVLASSWLESKTARSKGSNAPSNGSLKYVALGLLAVFSLSVSAFALVKTAPADTTKFASVVKAPASDAAAKDPRAIKIDAALASDSWPELVPSLGEVKTARAEQLTANTGCMFPSNFADVSTCTYGDPNASRTAVVIGDSVAISWMPAVLEALSADGYKVRGIGFGSCPFVMADVLLKNLPTETTKCNESHDKALGLIEKINPALVLMSNHEGAIQTLATGATDLAAKEQWVTARQTAIGAVQAPGRKVAVIAAPPAGKNIQECATNFSKPADCLTRIGANWKLTSDADKAAADAAGAIYIDTRSWFCSIDEYCPIFVGNTPIRFDVLHLTQPYAKELAPTLRAALGGP